MLRTLIFNTLTMCDSDEEFLEFLDELYLQRNDLDNFVSKRVKEKTPNELLKEIFFTTEQLKERLKDGEKFIDIETVAQLAFYKSKAKEKDES